MKKFSATSYIFKEKEFMDLLGIKGKYVTEMVRFESNTIKVTVRDNPA